MPDLVITGIRFLAPNSTSTNRLSKSDLGRPSFESLLLRYVGGKS